MEPAIVVGITFASILIGITGFAIYTSFGPPSAALDDPFDDHED
jgi:PsbN protein